MNRIVKAVALIVLWSCFCSASADSRLASPKQIRILLVGNSIVYTNNLPAFLSKLAASQPRGPSLSVDMFVRGGAKLTELLSDRRLRDAIRENSYDLIVLQERGGPALCAAGKDLASDPECREIVTAYRRFQSTWDGVRLLYLGTYQTVPEVSVALVRGEKALSAELQAEHVSISEHLRQLSTQLKGKGWFHKDNSHPGPFTTFLMSIELYQTIVGKYPEPAALCLDQNTFQPTERLDGLIKFDYSMTPTRPEECLITKQDAAALINALSVSKQR